MTEDVMSSISSDLSRFWEDGRFEARRKVAVRVELESAAGSCRGEGHHQVPKQGPPPGRPPVDDGAIDTLMSFPLVDDPVYAADMDLKMDALLKDIRDDARISILKVVDHIFEGKIT
jgi:hypothetical protein